MTDYRNHPISTQSLQVWCQGSPKENMYQECHKMAVVHGQDEDARHTAEANQWGYSEHH